MYCSTCGALVPVGRTVCDTCGARLPFVPRPVARPGGLAGMTTSYAPYRPPGVVAACPRCAYRGEGVGYFTSGRHIAGLVAATMFTSWGMGVGGLVYFLLRREYRICPRCSESWGPRGEHALAPSEAGQETAPVVYPPNPAIAAADVSGSGWAIALFIIAAMLTVGAIASGNPGALGFAAIAAGGGVVLHRASESRREARRAALLSSLQLPVLQLAAERGGRLTVTEVAARFGWTLPRSEKVLESLNDGYRVNSEVTDEGLIVYEFRELLHAPSRPDRSLQGE